MTSLTTLLNARTAVQNRGVEELKNGTVWSWVHADAYTVGRCQFCWFAPATGTAVVEIWGAQGSGSMMCCCGGGGIPPNPGGYVKKTVCVTGGSSYICGWVGYAPQASTICYNGQSNCSVACFFNTSNNVILCAGGGFGGWQWCTTGTAIYCCYVACAFCNTFSGTNYCGVVCNVGGGIGSSAAIAGGGDVNIPGGISCVNILECCNYWPHCYEYTIALAGGMFSSTCPTCVRFVRQPNATNGNQFASTGRCDFMHAMHSQLPQAIPMNNNCWWSQWDCGCYEWSGCQYGTQGAPGVPGFPCSNVRAMGMRGGHGHVRITLY